MDDSDLYGAILYIVLYGTFLLLSGKVFYGYIYGVAVFGTIALHVILSLMSPAAPPTDHSVPKAASHPVRNPPCSPILPVTPALGPAPPNPYPAPPGYADAEFAGGIPYPPKPPPPAELLPP